MDRKLMLFAICLGVLAALVAGCNDDSEQARSIVTVSSINSNAPFFSDVLDQGDSLLVTSDDFKREDWVTVMFSNRPYDQVLPFDSGQPVAEFLIDSYRVRWLRADGVTPVAGTNVPPDFLGATSVVIPSGDLATLSVVLVPVNVKELPFLTTLEYATGEILAIANYTFVGHEIGSDTEYEIEASITVNFADFNTSGN